LQEVTARFKWIITQHTQRSVEYFGLLVGVLYGSSVDN
jgi:hypothetical protein